MLINEPFTCHLHFCSWRTGTKEMMERKVTTPDCLFQFSSKLPAKAKKCKNLHWTCSCSVQLGKWEVLQSAYIPPVLIVKLLVSLTRDYYPFVICAKCPEELVNWVYIACFPAGWQHHPSGRLGGGLPVLKLKQRAQGPAGVTRLPHHLCQLWAPWAALPQEWEA